MALHICQIGPTDTALPCPGLERFEAGNLSAPISPLLLNPRVHELIFFFFGIQKWKILSCSISSLKYEKNSQKNVHHHQGTETWDFLCCIRTTRCSRGSASVCIRYAAFISLCRFSSLRCSPCTVHLNFLHFLFFMVFLSTPFIFGMSIFFITFCSVNFWV